jgi:DNA-binding MarR family transcriptional regulator
VPHDITAIGLAVKRLQVRHHRTADVRLAPLGLTIVQWDALRHLHENPDASLHDLAQLTFQTDQAFGTLANRMIGRGLIERVPGPGRAARHRLTARGERLREEATTILRDVLASSFAPLTPAELETFGGYLDRLVARDPT